MCRAKFIILITYPENGRVVILKSRMRENLKSGSVRGLCVLLDKVF